MKPEGNPAAIVERMVFLARQLGTKAPDEVRERQFLTALEGRATAHLTRHKRRQFTVFALAAAACLGPLIWLGVHAEHRLSYRVTGGSVSEGSIVGLAGTSVTFSDGSRLKLNDGARARIAQVTAHGARVDLVDGQVSVDIVKADGNAWFIQAGPYEVHVIGTAFDVRWTKERRQIEVDLHRGSVVVTGPHIGQLRLQSGQRLTGASDGPSTVTRGDQTEATLPPSTINSAKAAPEPAPETDSEPVADLSATSVERRDPAAAGPTGWSHLVAQGDFEGVLAAAQRRGIDNVLSTGTLTELSALADAARYGRNTQLARRALLSERRRFPGAAAARGAAFFLGGIEADGSAAALAWYETYLAESPAGPYAAQALGRRMMLVHRRGGVVASAPLAREYLKRFAQGPYASAAHKILEHSSE